MTSSNIDTLIQEKKSEISQAKFSLAKLEYIKSLYPDIKYYRGRFSSKAINSSYEQVECNNSWSGLEMLVYKTIKFKYGELETDINIYSIPNTNKIATLKYSYAGGKQNITISFTKFCKTFKSKKYDESILKKVRHATLDYLEKYKNYKVDYTNLDEKTKKLLLFT